MNQKEEWSKNKSPEAVASVNPIQDELFGAALGSGEGPKRSPYLKSVTHILQ